MRGMEGADEGNGMHSCLGGFCPIIPDYRSVNDLYAVLEIQNQKMEPLLQPFLTGDAFIVDLGTEAGRFTALQDKGEIATACLLAINTTLARNGFDNSLQDASASTARPLARCKSWRASCRKS